MNFVHLLHILLLVCVQHNGLVNKISLDLASLLLTLVKWERGEKEIQFRESEDSGRWSELNWFQLLLQHASMSVITQASKEVEKAR